MSAWTQGWAVTKLPSGETRLDLDQGRTRLRLAMELVFVVFAAGMGLLMLLLNDLLFQLTGVAIAAVAAGFGVRSVMMPSPKAWVLAPGRATVEWKSGKQETFTPSKVIIESYRERPGALTRTYRSVYGVSLETPVGRVDVHGGAPLGDRHDLARTAAEALGVELVEVWLKPPAD
jgi:hypothetical protein